MSVFTVGIDVSLQTLAVGIKAPGSAPTFLGSFPNDPAHFEQLASALREQAQQHQVTVIHLVLEPTGGYEQLLAHFALRQGWRVSLPNPKHVRDWAKGVGIRAKTDRQDALKLTRYGAEQELPSWAPLPENVAALNTLLERRNDLVGMLRQEENRRHALQAREEYHGPAAQSLEKSIAWLQQALAEIDAATREHIDQHPELQEQLRRLRQVPGVGERNAPFLLVLLFRWGALTDYQGSSKGLTAYVGLDPQPFESGSSVRKPSTTSRQGDPTLRSLLFMSALGGIRGDNALRAFYQRLVEGGKRKKVALVATARKILIWSWAVFRDQTSFDPKLAGAA
jgi:transposase